MRHRPAERGQPEGEKGEEHPAHLLAGARIGSGVLWHPEFPRWRSGTSLARKRCRGSSSLSSWSAQADHPRVFSLSTEEQKAKRGWSACADHDGGGQQGGTTASPRTAGGGSMPGMPCSAAQGGRCHGAARVGRARDAGRREAVGRPGATAGGSARCPPTAGRGPSRRATRRRTGSRRTPGSPSPATRSAPPTPLCRRGSASTPRSRAACSPISSAKARCSCRPNRVNFHTIEPEFDFVMGRSARPPRRALYPRGIAGGGRQRPPGDRNSRFALRRLARDDGGGFDRRQRDRRPALPRPGGRRRARLATSPPSKSPCAATARPAAEGFRKQRPRRPVERPGLARHQPRRPRRHPGGRPHRHHRQRHRHRPVPPRRHRHRRFRPARTGGGAVWGGLSVRGVAWGAGGVGEPTTLSSLGSR